MHVIPLRGKNSRLEEIDFLKLWCIVVFPKSVIWLRWQKLKSTKMLTSISQKSVKVQIFLA